MEKAGAMQVTPRFTDPDNQGLVIEHASGVRPDHEVYSPLGGGIIGPALLVPPWGADTHDGYDIYAGNWPVDPALVPPLAIGAHKASEGFGTYDARFAEWVRTVSARHRYRGAYHVIWPWRSGKPDNYIEQQAESYYNFTRSAGVDWAQAGWFVQIDNEQFSGMPRVANVEEVRRFADWLIARIGKKISHYCNPVTDPQLFFAPELADLPKWEAQYNRNESREPTMIRQWGGWPVDGIWNNRPCDANYIEDRDELDATTGYALTPGEDDDMDSNPFGYVEVRTNPADPNTTAYIGQLMQGLDGELYQGYSGGEGVAAYAFGKPGIVEKVAYEKLPVFDKDKQATWLMSHAAAPVVNLNPVLTAIAALGTQISALSASITANFSNTNQNIGLVGASVAASRTQLDGITATVNEIKGAINTGGGDGDCDLTPVLDAIAALDAKLEDLEVTVNFTGTGTTK